MHDRKKNILLVEDDAILADIFSRVLQKAGYSVTTTENGQQAMDALDETPYALVVLDIFLKGPNGLAFLHELRSYDDLLKLPVVVCTSDIDLFSSEDVLRQYSIAEVIDKTTMKPTDLVAVAARYS